MPLSNASLLGDDLLARWLIENSPVKVPFFQAWAWQSVTGNPLKYSRSSALNAAQQVEECSFVGEQLPTVSNASFSIQEFITRYQICTYDLDTYQHPNQLETAMYALAKRRLLYGYATFIADPSHSASLVSICDPARRISMGGLALTLDCLDEAYELVTAGTGRPTLIMSHSRSLRTYRSLCRAAGICQPRIPWRWYDPAKGRMVEGSVDAFNGTPWLANDWINELAEPVNERVFFMVMGDDGGAGPTRGVTGIIPAAQGRNLFNRRVVQGIIDPNGGGPGAADMKPGTDTWVSMPAGLALGSQGALSIIENYTTVASCGG